MRFYDASMRTDLGVPFDVLADLIAYVREHTDRCVVIGAVARDLLASGAGGLPAARATKDVDIAIAVPAMSDYAALGELSLDRTHPHHRFRGVPVDVLPFGPVERGRRVLFDNDHELDVTGLAEACASSVQVRLPGGTDVPVASLPAQSALKLLAWRDRGNASHRKDALDLLMILRAASSGVFEADVFEDPAFEACGYDLLVTGARRLGRQVVSILGAEARADVEAVLEHHEGRAELARSMEGVVAAELLDAYRAGLRDDPRPEVDGP